VNEHQEPTPHVVACEFLDQWFKVHTEKGRSAVDYSQLGVKFMAFENTDDGNRVSEIQKALGVERKARGWPDPTPDTIEPSIEGAIMVLRLGAMRSARY
jgi:hypothetical protein